MSGGGGGPKGAVCAIPAGADWRAYCEAIRPLKTNCGVPIRKLVEAALAALDGGGAADEDGQQRAAIRRELNEAKRAWVGNAAGTCKRGALAALDARGGWDGPPLDWQRHLSLAAADEEDGPPRCRSAPHPRRAGIWPDDKQRRAAPRIRYESSATLALALLQASFSLL